MQKAVDEGEYYRARKMLQDFLEVHPKSAEGEKLMADILDQEIARQKEVFDNKVPEEMSEQDKTGAGKIWLDRAQTLLSIGQYDQALLAAEKVFIYDPENLRASQLIDEIRKKAIEEGKDDKAFLKQEFHDEIRERVERYRAQAQTWVEQGRWGAARLAVEKILLLVPEDKQALDLYERIKSEIQKPS